MKKNLLLTGFPGVGKTTLVKGVAQAYPRDSLAGFYTQEIREGEVRKGFTIKTFTGCQAVLSHVDFKAGPKVGKYRIDLRTIEEIILPAMQISKSVQLIVIDEIGKMECFSAAFRAAVLNALNGPVSVLATIAKRGDPFIEQIKNRADVLLQEVTLANRQRLAEEILAALKG